MRTTRFVARSAPPGVLLNVDVSKFYTPLHKPQSVDDGQHIVEIVRETTGQLTDRFHLR
jgi:hypothetical protein